MYNFQLLYFSITMHRYWNTNNKKLWQLDNCSMFASMFAHAGDIWFGAIYLFNVVF